MAEFASRTRSLGKLCTFSLLLTVGAAGLRRKRPASKTGAVATAVSHEHVVRNHYEEGDTGVDVAVSKEGKLVAKHFAHNFSRREVEILGHAPSQPAGCTPAGTVFDLGFYDGVDSLSYLQSGLCVVGVEADPDLINAAVDHYAVWIAQGKLQLVNAAVAPSQEQPWTTFYRNKCTREWNSFYWSVGCRTCEAPYKPAEIGCDSVSVAALDCGQIFTQFGMPHYLKLDIEGAESGCFAALSSYAAHGPTQMPQFVSAEITQLNYLDSLLGLGYTSFKLVRQDSLHSGVSSHSGPWGENALDCRTGAAWRTYAEARAELDAILAKDFDAADACPGGVCLIHGDAGCGDAFMWYDVHATFAPGNVVGR